jgi:hypothetical protein
MERMAYLIDGHNLVPRIPGLSLRAIDDEDALIKLLQDFCRLARKNAEVYFDNAPPGAPQAQSYGRVNARFVRRGMTADQAIRNRLASLGRNATNWSVVSSDQAVQSAARQAGAKTLSAEDFSRLLQQTIQKGERQSKNKNLETLSSQEVDYWMKLFNQEQKK